MEKHRQALPPSLPSDHRHDLSARSNRGKWRMTEMQWSCKTTKFHITLCLNSSVQQRGQNGLFWRNAWTRVCFFCLQLFSFLFSSPPMIFAVRVCHPSPGSRWSPLSWQTLEVSQADTNIEHHPHIARTKLSREGTWFNLFWSSLYLSNLLLSPHQFCVRGLLFLYGH